MKVAFCNRPKWDAPLGGDGVQMLKTKEALEKKYDVSIDIITDPADLSHEYDIIHVFNLLSYKITLSFCRKGDELGIPVVISSIFWDYSYAYDRLTNFFIFNKLSARSAALLRFLTHLSARLIQKPAFFSQKFRRALTECCNISKAVLPNSTEEGKLLQEFLRLDLDEKISIVYNGVETSEQHCAISQEEFLKKYNIPEKYVLQVGRIEPVKNQINLLYALRKDRDVPIVYLGKVNNGRYYRKVKRLAQKRGNVYFIDAVPHDQVTAFYKYASVHVLLSLRESPGLVSLEAQSMGCPIIVANALYAPVATYFRSNAFVVDPFDFNGIAQAVKDAYKSPRTELKPTDFTWEIAAEQTFNIYKKVKP